MTNNNIAELNKQTFINLIKGIKRKDAKIEELIENLEKSDFFTAPASTKYHDAFKGGLCYHSLKVYYNLKNLCRMIPGLSNDCYDEDSLRIVALLHDISKKDIYTTAVKNSRVYCNDGEKEDALGRFNWVSKVIYVTREDKLVYGSHEMTSEYIIRQYIPLTMSESIAILHHMGGMHYDCAQDNISEIFDKYPLALMLHLADMIASYEENVVVDVEQYIDQRVKELVQNNESNHQE